MTDRLRIGIAGTGFIGEVHARAARAAGAVVTGVASSTPARAVAAAGHLRVDHAAASAEELAVADYIDVLHVCTPNHLHAGLAQLALAAGKHVVCEKPLATSVADAEKLLDAASQTGLVATVPFAYRYYPTVREARARIQLGATGPVHLVHGSYLQDWLSSADDDNWRTDPAVGGASRAFADIGVHWCDLAEFTSGHRIVRLVARMLTAVPERRSPLATPIGTEDAATILFETDNGAIGSLVVSQVSPGRKNRLWLSLDGPSSSLSFDQELPESLWVGTRGESMLVPRGSPAMSDAAARYSVLPVGHPQGFQDCFNAFVADTYAAIAGDPPEGLPTFADGLRSAVLTQAVIESAATDRWVEVPR
ncbi:Gfo/Idh/MocA family protein [Streptomyces sp. NPDC058289]|uniref:Gfo/Idh/MocA family protein n=1 Tax=Streptomyces sp. NPDC058289 TaxID=3346425 RepID=UPI0036DFC331